jgi:hypothetical protein
MRLRLRRALAADELAGHNPVPLDHRAWPDHVERVAETIALARKLGPVDSAADLSAGDGAIIQALDVGRRHLGDFAPGHEYTGMVEDTIWTIPDVDLFVLTETCEHLDDPDAVLKAIRGKARMLVLSTPLDAWNDTNPEHYFAWDREGVEEMLIDAGWAVTEFLDLDYRSHGPASYRFGCWTCS